MKPRIVIVDDHQIFRAGVRAELEERVDIVGDAATVDEAVAAKPTLDLDAKWVRPGGFLTGDAFTRMAYQSLKSGSARAAR